MLKRHFRNGIDTTDRTQRLEAMGRAIDHLDKALDELARFHWDRSDPLLAIQLRGLIKTFAFAGRRFIEDTPSDARRA